MEMTVSYFGERMMRLLPLNYVGLRILEFKHGVAVLFTVKLLLQSGYAKQANEEELLKVLWLRWVSKTVDGFCEYWPGSDGWGLRASGDVARPTRVLSALSGTLSSYICLPIGLCSLELVKLERSVQNSEESDSQSAPWMTLSTSGLKDKDCLLVESLRVDSVHLSLSLSGGEEVGMWTCLWNSSNHRLSAPGEHEPGVLFSSCLWLHIVDPLPTCEVKQAGKEAEKRLKPFSKGIASAAQGSQDQHQELGWVWRWEFVGRQILRFSVAFGDVSMGSHPDGLLPQNKPPQNIMT